NATSALVYVFFLSSRRRHTSFSRDWSSDVCSSDLPTPSRSPAHRRGRGRGRIFRARRCAGLRFGVGVLVEALLEAAHRLAEVLADRKSVRVGEEGRSRGSTENENRPVRQKATVGCE